MPDIFTFSDYRAYLNDWIDYARKKQVTNMSRLAKAIGVHASYLAHVMSGEKNLSFEQAAELSDVLKHSPLEREYFFALLHLERAGTKKLKKYSEEKRALILSERLKVRSRVGEHHELTAEERAIFYSSWIYVAVFVATAIHDGQTVAQIAERFELTPGKAEDILGFLVQTGLCELTGSTYSMGKLVVFLPNDSPLVVKHHTNWRIQAIQKMDNRKASELFYTAPMSISIADFERIREVLAKTIQTTLEICKDSPAEQVVCLNLDFFQTSK